MSVDIFSLGMILFEMIALEVSDCALNFSLFSYTRSVVSFRQCSARIHMWYVGHLQ